MDGLLVVFGTLGLFIYLWACNECAMAAGKQSVNKTAAFLLALFFTPITGFLYVIANKK